MSDAATPTYHLWVKPSGAAYEVLAGTIQRLARELQVSAFEPHVTLLAYLEGSEREHRLRTAELADRLATYECVLSRAAYLDEHFRCLFMLVEPTPTIMSCHAMAAQAFGKEAEPYMPHVSLVYGSFPESRKLEIIGTLPAEVRTSFLVKSVTLIRSDSMEPKDWHEIVEYPFRGHP